MQEECFEAHLVDDGEPEGQGMALDGAPRGGERELDVSGTDSLGVAPGRRRRAVEERVARSGADCLLLAAAPSAEALELLRDLRAARPSHALLRAGALAEPGVPAGARAGAGGAAAHHDADAAPRRPIPRPSRRFFERLPRPLRPHARTCARCTATRRCGRSSHAIDDAGELGNDRSEVIRAFFGIDDRESVLGTYDIDDNGDTTLGVYGANRVRGGRLSFDGVVELADG